MIPGGDATKTPTCADITRPFPQDWIDFLKRHCDDPIHPMPCVCESPAPASPTDAYTAEPPPAAPDAATPPQPDAAQPEADLAEIQRIRTERSPDYVPLRELVTEESLKAYTANLRTRQSGFAPGSNGQAILTSSGPFGIRRDEYPLLGLTSEQYVNYQVLRAGTTDATLERFSAEQLENYANGSFQNPALAELQRRWTEFHTQHRTGLYIHLKSDNEIATALSGVNVEEIVAGLPIPIAMARDFQKALEKKRDGRDPPAIRNLIQHVEKTIPLALLVVATYGPNGSDGVEARLTAEAQGLSSEKLEQGIPNFDFKQYLIYYAGLKREAAKKQTAKRTARR